MITLDKGVWRSVHNRSPLENILDNVAGVEMEGRGDLPVRLACNATTETNGHCFRGLRALHFISLCRLHEVQSIFCIRLFSLIYFSIKLVHLIPRN